MLLSICKNIILLIMLNISLIACMGNAGSNNQDMLSASIGSKNINTAFVDNIGKTAITITNIYSTELTLNHIALDSINNAGKYNVTANNNQQIISINPQNINEDTIDKINSTCLNMTLKPLESCVLMINFDKVYTKRQTNTIKFNTNRGATKIHFDIWNHNVWLLHKPILSVKQISPNQKHEPNKNNINTYSNHSTTIHDDYLAYDEISGATGEKTIRVTNNDVTAIYINKIGLTTVSEFNKILAHKNTCGGSLLPKHSCDIVIDYEDLDARDVYQGKPLKEALQIGYLDGLDDIIVNYTNNIGANIQASMVCQHTGICNMQFNNQDSSHKIVFEKINYSAPSKPKDHNISITPTIQNGCIQGIDVVNNNFCSFDVVAKAIPTQYSSYVDLYFTYYINDATPVLIHTGGKSRISLNVQNFIKVTASANMPSLCASRGGIQQYHVWSDGFVVVTSNNLEQYNIKNIKFIPSNTNFEDYENRILITQEQAILQDDCTGHDFNQNNTCTIKLTAGCEGFASAGYLDASYTIGNNPTIFHDIWQLGNIIQPIVKVSAGQGMHFSEYWYSDRDLRDEFSVDVLPDHAAGFNISIIDTWGVAGTYFKISNNYNEYKELELLSCLGRNGMNPADNFFPTGRDKSCGIGMNFTNYPNTSIPIDLLVGNRAERHLKVIFNINNNKVKSTRYQAPIFIGAVSFHD